jgi:outer membrane protein assembly factor BamB
MGKYNRRQDRGWNKVGADRKTGKEISTLRCNRCLLVFCSLWLIFLLTNGETWSYPGLLLLDIPDRPSFTGFASSLAAVGDLDGDGTPDYVVGAYVHRWKGSEKEGRVFVFSGRSGQLLFQLGLPDPHLSTNPYEGAAFGCAVAGIGDLNNDGVGEVLIGAFGQEQSGSAYVFSGKEGNLLYTLHAPVRQLSAGFGWAVASVGDVTGDAIPEMAIGAFAQEGNGRVFIYDGHTGALLRTTAPPALSPSLTFGWSVASAGDLDQDGVPDLLVGAPYTPVGTAAVQGRAYAFRGRDGALLRVFDAPQSSAGAAFGWSMTSAGDLNGDGIPEVLIGAPYQDVRTQQAQGAAFVFNGGDGQLLLTLHDPVPGPYAGFGLVVSGIADISQDGIPDLLIAAPYQTVDKFQVQGEVFLFDGHTGHQVTTFDNPFPHQGSRFGYAAVSPGDVDGDKIPDFAIGAAGQSIMANVAVGRVYVLRSRAQHATGATSADH